MDWLRLALKTSAKDIGMRNWILAGGAIALIATCAVAQRGQRLPTECRKEIVQLCGMNRDAIRSCLMEKASELSENCRSELRERMGQRGGNAVTTRAAAGATELAYGREPLQKLDFWKARTAGAPLVIFVHGGGWKRGDKSNATGSSKAPHYLDQGYAFASMNYRLVPEATVEEQAADVARSIAYLHNNAQRLGIDSKRIVLMGHSAGAHLSALVGTDPQYLSGVGLDLSLLSGVIPLDGAAYDVPTQMTDGARIMQDTYKQAFGTDPQRQKALSPYWQSAAPNAPAFLILHVDRDDGARQSAALADALRKNGAEVQLQAFDGKGLKGHAEINRKLGETDYPATPVVDNWLRRIFGS
jgi:arylformamidase